MDESPPKVSGCSWPPDQAKLRGQKRGNSSGIVSRTTEGPRPHALPLQGWHRGGPLSTPRRWGSLDMGAEAHVGGREGPGVYGDTQAWWDGVQLNESSRGHFVTIEAFEAPREVGVPA